MLMTKKKRPAVRTLRGWAISVLNEAGAIRECEEHGWALDRAVPHARERAIDLARQARRPASPRKEPWRRSATSSIRSATPARVVRRTKARSVIYQTARFCRDASRRQTRML
jgi:hypothetical protein